MPTVTRLAQSCSIPANCRGIFVSTCMGATCVCILSTEGRSVCIEEASCGNACASSNDCADDEVRATESWCGQGNFFAKLHKRGRDGAQVSCLHRLA
ncbi:uncharacterized protein LY79DRAFT_565741 [Colletotrichum navitas]|uniref:Uncharacterized protein n=1 Tax=Colletotrichum navitas TaxID=681940 RepID=A0AAD8PQG3_9PEZI|nr:uncharacterized protein LY79DRAFT_565741 [Colletotrichum navitas]KAK1574495.1 hypothetical protein LY79DRAFT_565741 [Colletotrichum navitas]